MSALHRKSSFLFMTPYIQEGGLNSCSLWESLNYGPYHDRVDLFRLKNKLFHTPSPYHQDSSKNKDKCILRFVCFFFFIFVVLIHDLYSFHQNLLLTDLFQKQTQCWKVVGYQAKLDQLWVDIATLCTNFCHFDNQLLKQKSTQYKGDQAI